MAGSQDWAGSTGRQRQSIRINRCHTWFKSLTMDGTYKRCSPLSREERKTPSCRSSVVVLPASYRECHASDCALTCRKTSDAPSRPSVGPRGRWALKTHRHSANPPFDPCLHAFEGPQEPLMDAKMRLTIEISHLCNTFLSNLGCLDPIYSLTVVAKPPKIRKTKTRLTFVTS
jgi:hypothetical protein